MSIFVVPSTSSFYFYVQLAVSVSVSDGVLYDITLIIAS